MYVVGYVGCGEILLGADWNMNGKPMTFHSVLGMENHPNRGSYFFTNQNFPVIIHILMVFYTR